MSEPRIEAIVCGSYEAHADYPARLKVMQLKIGDRFYNCPTKEEVHLLMAKHVHEVVVVSFNQCATCAMAEDDVNEFLREEDEDGQDHHEPPADG